MMNHQNLRLSPKCSGTKPMWIAHAMKLRVSWVAILLARSSFSDSNESLGVSEKVTATAISKLAIWACLKGTTESCGCRLVSPLCCVCHSFAYHLSCLCSTLFDIVRPLLGCFLTKTGCQATEIPSEAPCSSVQDSQPAPNPAAPAEPTGGASWGGLVKHLFFSDSRVAEFKHLAYGSSWMFFLDVLTTWVCPK